MQDTLFEKIITREIPAEIIYEDDLVISFLDIKPINRGHSLVVPKQKFVNVLDANPDTLAHMIKVGQRIALTIKETVGADGFNLLMNNGRAAGQEVFHAHLHIIPRREGDGAYQPAKHISYEPGEIASVAHTIREALG